MAEGSSAYERARAAYQALCELEDEFDALYADRLNEATRNELQCLRRCWEHDTARKVERALGEPA